MDIIFPSYSRSYRHFELGQTPSTGADAAFAELDAEMARIEAERQAAAAAAAAAAATAPAPAAPTVPPASSLSIRHPLVDTSHIKQKPPLFDRIKKAFFVGPPAPTSAGTLKPESKIDWPIYIGAAVLVAAVVGGVVYYRRRKG